MNPFLKRKVAISDNYKADANAASKRIGGAELATFKEGICIMTDTSLFDPVSLGTLQLPHRIVRRQ